MHVFVFGNAEVQSHGLAEGNIDALFEVARFVMDGAVVVVFDDGLEVDFLSGELFGYLGFEVAGFADGAVDGVGAVVAE